MMETCFFDKLMWLNTAILKHLVFVSCLRFNMFSENTNVVVQTCLSWDTTWRMFHACLLQSCKLNICSASVQSLNTFFLCLSTSGSCQTARHALQKLFGDKPWSVKLWWHVANGHFSLVFKPHWSMSIADASLWWHAASQMHQKQPETRFVNWLSQVLSFAFSWKLSDHQRHLEMNSRNSSVGWTMLCKSLPLYFPCTFWLLPFLGNHG